MLEILLFVAIAVIVAQAIIIALLVDLVNKTREEKKKQGKELKGFIKALVKTTSESQTELKDYKDAYNACYKEYSVLFKENKILKERLNYTEQLHSHVVETLHTLLKEGRVIKTKHFDNMIPYENFGRLSNEDRIELFGA